MKIYSFLLSLGLLFCGIISFGFIPQEEQLWLLTAKVTQISTLQRDTVINIDAEGHAWIKESHATVQTFAQGQVTAVIENQAENPATEFLFISDSGEPKMITVSGNGIHTEVSTYQETIDGKLINEDDRNINVSGSPLPEASIQFGYSADTKYADISIHISAKGSDKGRMFDGKWKDYGGNVKDYGISCGAGCNLSSDQKCSVTKTSKGYQASWRQSKSRQLHTVSGTDFITEESSVEVTIVPYKEHDKPQITLNGCSELGTEEQSNVVASGKPEGGKFRFWVEPENLLKVQSDGKSSANLTGATPGKGTLYVEYTSLEGKVNQTSQAASCVKIENYNGGQEIPQIGLFDIDGKKKNGILTVPVKAVPADATELVKFEPANPGVLSAVGGGSEVTLQGLTVGTTTLQAKTKCGATTGPAVEVEVVNCDKETVEALERMREQALETLKEATEELQHIGNSEEFQKARDELVTATGELALKTTLTILSGGKIHGTAHTAVEIAEAVETVWEMIHSANSQEFNQRTAIGACKTLTEGAAKAALGAIGVHEAAKKFGDIIAELLQHDRELENAMKTYEKADQDLDKIMRRQRVCKGEKSETPKKDVPKPDPKPDPAKPNPPTKPTPPTKPDPKTEEPPVQEPTTDVPTSDDEVIVDPEPPTVPSKQVGLPYEPSTCGCNQTKELTTSSKGFSTLGVGMKNLGNCVENFTSTSLNDYQNALQEISSITEEISVSLNSGTSAFQAKAKETEPKLDELIQRVKSYEKAGTEFLKTMEKCPQSVSSGMEILKSVETITIDSIKTKY